MVLPEPFTTTSPKIVSFDFFEFASNTGYKRFYGFNDSDGDYGLSTQTLYSEDTETLVSTSFDQDLDMQFKKTLTVNGKAFVNATTFFYNSSGLSVTPAYDLTINVIHYDGTTETNIGTKTVSWTGALTGSTGSLSNLHAIQIDISKKSFSPSDTLRLNVIMTEATNGQYYITHDPKDRTVTHGTSSSTSSLLTFDIPFESN